MKFHLANGGPVLLRATPPPTEQAHKQADTR